MIGQRRGPGRRIGVLAVLLWTAPWLVGQAAESNKPDEDEAPASTKPTASSSETAPTTTTTSDYVRAAQAARERARAATGESPVLSNEDLPALPRMDRQRADTETPTRPKRDESDGGKSARARRSEATRPAMPTPRVESSEKQKDSSGSLERLEQRRAKTSRWKQRLARAEADLQTAEQRVAQLEGDGAGSAGGDPAELREARNELAEVRARIRNLQRQNPDG